MPRYFFDIYEDNDKTGKDTEGHEFSGSDEARREAQRLLPEIAYHEISRKGDRKIFVVLVRDAEGKSVYAASLHYAGLDLC